MTQINSCIYRALSAIHHSDLAIDGEAIHAITAACPPVHNDTSGVCKKELDSTGKISPKSNIKLYNRPQHDCEFSYHWGPDGLPPRPLGQGPADDGTSLSNFRNFRVKCQD